MTNTSTASPTIAEVTERYGYDWLHQTMHWSELNDAELSTLLEDENFVDEISSASFWSAMTEAGRRGVA